MRDAQLVRFAAVLVVLSGYLFVFRAGEDRIGERVDQNARTAGRIAAAERTLASASALRAERSRLRANLRNVELSADRSALVARFVRDAARIAAGRRTTIAAITAGTTAISAQAAPDAFDTIPLEVVVEGRYADVLATVRALSAARVLAAVEIASLARKNADAADATLTAALHVVLQHAAPLGPTGARAQPV